MTIISFFIQDWEDFSKKHNGSLKITKTGLSPLGGGMSEWQRVYLTIPHYDSNIVFFTGEAAQMRIYYDFKKDIRFNFLIYKEDYLDKIGKRFNLINEIEINDSEFDKVFIIKSNDESLVKKVLCKSIKEFLIMNRMYLANFKLDKEKNTTVLNLNAPFDENNLTHMEDVLSFMKKTIDIIVGFNTKTNANNKQA